MKIQPKILVVGSFVMDQIAETSVFPQEGQTVLGEKFSKAPGGKGANQAVQAARLGASVTMAGKLGKDASGAEMIEACRAEGISTEHICWDPERPSGCSVIILEKDAEGQARNRIIVLPGANMSLSAEDLSFLETAIGQYDLVMLQLEIPLAVNMYVAELAAKHHVPVMLNSAPSAPLPDAFLRNLAYISPNEHEAADLTGITIQHTGKTVSLEDARAATDALRAKGIKNVLITLGNAGAVLHTDSGFCYAPCAEGVTAVDPTAAGDSFVSAFCMGVCMGWDPEKVLLFANHTAAITVSRMGAMPSLPRMDEVIRDLKERGKDFPIE